MKGPVMSRSMKEWVEAYWAGRLAQHEVFCSMLRATDVELIEPRQCDDTPDALFNVSYRDGGFKKLWCQITGAWNSREEAQEFFQFTEGQRHPPAQPDGIMLDTDARTANSVRAAIMRTLKKDSYRELISEYGPRHLHVHIANKYSPLFIESTRSRIFARIPTEDLKYQSIFRSLSMGCNEEVYCLWKNSQSLDRMP